MALELLLIGFLSILGQVVLLRELDVALYGIELVYILALGAWLAWTAVGSWLPLRRRSLVPMHTLRILMLVTALILPLDIAFIRASHHLMTGVPGAYLPFGTQLIVILLAMMPVGLLLGLLFQFTARRGVARGTTLARAYGIESAGGLLGGLAATLLLWRGVPNFSAALLGGGAVAGIMMLVSAARASERARGRPLAAGVVFVVFALLFSWARPLDFMMTRWNHPELVASRDTPYGRITLTERDGQLTLFENNALAFETGGTSAEELVHPALLQHPDPGKVLLLGGGYAGLASEVLKHDPARVDYIELNPAFLTMTRHLLPEEVAGSLQDSRVHVEVDDPRAALDRERDADVIIIGMPDPTTSQANRFYTRDFFRLCARSLGRGGILALRLQVSENYWTPPARQRLAAVRNALADVFEDVVVLPGTQALMFASDHTLPRDAELPVERWRQRGIESHLISPAYLRYLYTNERFTRMEQELAGMETEANTDSHPVCYRYAWMIWLSKFFPGFAYWGAPPEQEGEPGVFEPLFDALFVGLIFSLLIVRKRGRGRYQLVVFAAGFLGMMAETLLLLIYQVKEGVLFQNLGLLLMMFMGGLAAGGLLAHRLAVKRKTARAPGIWIGVVLLAGVAVLFLVLAALLAREMSPGLVGSLLLMGFAGLMTAGLFAYASFRHPGDPVEGVSPLYASDLAGGCIGSLAASLLLVPLTGLLNTSLAGTLIVGLAVVVV